MPVSDVDNIAPIVKEAKRLNPRTVLDLGVGYGLVGAALRQYLDIEGGRINPSEWQTRIYGVEGFKTYRNPLWDCYDDIVINDFTRDSRYKDSIYTDYDYDLVLMVDSLEHIDKELGRPFLEGLINNNKHVIVSTPFGFHPQGAVNGNEFERHRSLWTEQDFVNLSGKLLHRGVCIVYSIPGRG